MRKRTVAEIESSGGTALGIEVNVSATTRWSVFSDKYHSS
jgi:hypothetical protein